jgi:hypothetical protein
MIVTFRGYQPPSRYDGLPFTLARIEESQDNSAFSLVEVLPLVPVDTDPSRPLSRDFTTELATLVDGWYRLTFIDATGDESSPTESLQYRSVTPYATESDIRPYIEDIAALLRGRLKEGAFTATSKPNISQIERILTLASYSIMGRINARIPIEQADFARHVVGLEACRMVEQSYYVEQINTDFSMFDPITTMFNTAMIELINACRYPMTTNLQ